MTSQIYQTHENFSNYMGRVWTHMKLDINEITSTSATNTEVETEWKERAEGPKKILILMSDTGGGHRASAVSLKDALETMHPEGSLDIKIVDALEDYTLWFSNRMYNWYTTYPIVWGTLYKHTKSTAGLPWPVDTSKFLEPTVRSGFRRCVEAEKPDLVISVHPIMQAIALSHFMPKTWRKKGMKIPFLTCVTDLGEAHPWWFNPEADKLFVPTENMKKKALSCGLKEDQISVVGLPLRQGFWNVDVTESNTQEKRKILGLQKERKLILVMGGGDGMGKLKEIVLNLGKQLEDQSANVHMVVVCGRNAALEKKLVSNKWGPETVMRPQHEDGTKLTEENADSDKKVFLSILGFVKNMEEWMIAADILVTKAGPGTIAEAAVCGLPCMLYDFLPGQEEGNITFVKEQGMGTYEEVPTKAAEVVCQWLSDPAILTDLSAKAKAASNAKAAVQIAEEVSKFLQINEQEDATDIEEAVE
mmetsp:Transcript_713/g.1147  ORF Transcript_713/g.1147 Transcript_713/m.1147 type:complete len:475 (+) Transcript_713:233-1657(+)